MAKPAANKPAAAGKTQPPKQPQKPGSSAPAKSGGMVMLILGLVGGGLVATGGGWFLGGMIAGAAIERLAPEPAKDAVSPLAASAEGSGKDGSKPAAKDDHAKGGKAGASDGEGDHAADGHDADGHGKAGPVETLPAITTNLAGPGESWIRLELAVVVKGDGPLDETEKSILADAFLASLRNTTLQSITGPSGMLHLREDLTDTALLAAGERISDIRIVSMVVE
jgi:flagellar basal body-associated protein FliL